MSGRIDWAACLRAGVLTLGLPPDAVWRLAPCELSALLDAAPSALGREDLAAMMARHPDQGDRHDG